LARPGDLLAIIAAMPYLLLSAQQDLPRTIGSIAIEKRFGNLGKEVGTHRVTGKRSPQPLANSMPDNPRSGNSAKLPIRWITESRGREMLAWKLCAPALNLKASEQADGVNARLLIGFHGRSAPKHISGPWIRNTELPYSLNSVHCPGSELLDRPHSDVL
jgi:hypothetical protein